MTLRSSPQPIAWMSRRPLGPVACPARPGLFIPSRARDGAIVAHVVLFLWCITTTTAGLSAEAKTRVPHVIFDTDMGSDCDDAGALAILHALADRGEAEILGVVFSSGKNRFGLGVCDAINTYYGRGDLPLGQYRGTDVGDPRDSYSKAIATATSRFGHDTVDAGPELVSVYKGLLRSQPDGSVTVITVGHPHGLVHLLRDPAGRDLVQQKVERWIAMGTGGWNFFQCGASAYTKELLEQWPTDFYISPAGKDVKTGNRQLPLTPVNNPVREAYRLWGNNALAHGRSSWDQLAVLFAIEPQHFQVEGNGCLEREDDGQVIWNSHRNNPRHHLVTPTRSTDEMAQIVESLMARRPAARVTD